MTDNVKPMAPIEFRRTVSVDSVNHPQRTITVIAVPYDQPAKVEYRSEIWLESFLRGALDAIAAAPHRVRVNRDHDRTRTVGKAIQFYPDAEQGCVAEIRIANTELGDETLALAAEDCLSSSVGFGVLPQDQILDRRSMTRKIKRAYLDHIAFVEQPAYDGAQVLAVRAENAAGLQPVLTPNLDEALADIGPLLEYRLPG